MAVATGTALALLIGSGISAGAQAYGAKKASDASQHATDAEASAAKDAAQVQAASAKEALDFSKDVYKQRRTDLNPYIGIGGAAAAKFADLMGLQIPPQQQQAPAQANPLPMDPSHIPPGQTFPANWVPRTPNAQMGKTAPPGATLAGVGVPRGSAGGVQMQAPDGSSRLVPEALVGLAEARGAKRVGGV